MKGKGWAWFRRPPHLVLLLAVLCASVCLAVGFIRSPRLYPVDHGQYDRMLADCGLTWTEEDLAAGDLQYVRPVTRFAYTRFPWAQLLSPLHLVEKCLTALLQGVLVG